MKKTKQLENLYFNNYPAFIDKIVASAIGKTNREDKNYSYKFNKKKSRIIINPQTYNQRWGE